MSVRFRKIMFRGPALRLCWVASAILAALSNVAMAGDSALKLSHRIELPSTKGRLDHMAIDLDGRRLFVAALGAGTVEVVDLKAGKRIDEIGGLHGPQGVVYLPGAGLVFVSNGAGGGVQAFAPGTALPVVAADALADADNLRFDPAESRLYAGTGNALAILDPVTLQIVKRIALANHPEAFELEKTGRRIFVNVPGAHHIAVVDRDRGSVTGTWEIADASQNFAMALDEPNHRLFVTTRKPSLLLVYDTRTGQRTAKLPICGDADDLFFDDRRLQLYAVCGEGFVEVIRQKDADHYEIRERTTTSRGARTGLFVRELSTLFVAVPATDGSAAEIRAYVLQ